LSDSHPSGEVLRSLPERARVLVIRLRSLGDCVLTTPALQLLKCARPDLQTAVMVEDRFAQIFEGNPNISAILSPSYSAAARWRPALTLNLHGGTRSQILAAASLAPNRAGFGHHRGAWIYTVRIPRVQQIFGVEKTMHTAQQLSSPIFYLGAPMTDIPRAALYAYEPRAGAPYAVIHPVAAAEYKTWRPEGFLAAAERLQQHGLEPVFMGTSADDLTAFSHYRVLQGASIREVKSWLAGASLFLGNDSGPAHMACALGVPVIVLYGRPEHEVIWAPWKPVASRTLVSRQGIWAIPTGDVIAAVDDLAARPGR
jgi:heptosyltransferase III